MPNRVVFAVDLIRKHKVTSYCEVGVKQGRMYSQVMRMCPWLKGYAVDPWEPVENSAESYEEWDFSAIYREFENNIAGDIAKRTEVMKMKSLSAVKFVSSVDMVFIDAAHDYENCRADIEAWLPKCRVVISGHDYSERWQGVMKAVDELVPDRKLDRVCWYDLIKEG